MNTMGLRGWITLALTSVLGISLLILSIAIFNRLGIPSPFGWGGGSWVSVLAAMTIVGLVTSLTAWRVRTIRAVVPVWPLFGVTAIVTIMFLTSLINQTSFGWVSGLWTWISTNWSWINVAIVSTAIFTGYGFWAMREDDAKWSKFLGYAFAIAMIVIVVRVLILAGLNGLFGDTEVGRMFQIGATNRENWLKLANDSGTPFQTILNGIDWKRVGSIIAVLFLLYVALIVFKTSKTIKAIVGMPAVVIAFAMIYWLAWGAVPQDFKEDLADTWESVAMATPLVDTPVEQQAKAAVAAASLLVAAAEAEAAAEARVRAEIVRINAEARLAAERRGKPVGSPDSINVPDCSADMDVWYELQTPGDWTVTDSWGSDIVTHEQFYEGEWKTAEPGRTGVSANRWCKYNERYRQTDMLLTWKYIGPV